MFSGSKRTILNQHKFIKGMRVKNQSVRIYQMGNSQYLVVKKKSSRIYISRKITFQL